MKGYSSFGVMIDMSRNAVMTVPALKSFITRIKRYGYNTVMLYTEDTYEVEGLPASAKPEGVPISFNSYTKTVSTAVF